MNAPLYTTEILRLAASLPAPRQLKRIDGSSEQRSPTCGSTLKLEVQLGDDGRVEALSQEVHACAFGQASASLLAASAEGLSAERAVEVLTQVEDWLSGRREDPGQWPELEALAPARTRRSRHGAILLPFRALAEALAGAT